MSLPRILILAGAALAAIFAAVLVNGAGSKKAPVEQVAVVGPSVLVAAKPIAVGQKISPEDLAWRAWPPEGVSGEMMTKDNAPKALEDVSGAFARMDIQSGAPIFPNQFAKTGDSHFMAAILAPGARAASLPISEETAAGGFVLPNDRVDVVLTREIDAQTPTSSGAMQNIKKVVTSTVLQNIRVLAIDQTYKDAKEGEAMKGVTATLELYPRQVEAFEKAKKQGQVSLTLRSVANVQGAGGENAGPSGEDGEMTRAAIRMHGYSYSSEAMTEQ